MTTVALRTSLIWLDEVMEDIVLEDPRAVTVGWHGKPTFVVPDLGLPNDFAIVRPGNRGYLLTLGENMRGTICIDGKEQDVAELVRRSGEAGGFCATPISGRDWGVVELDASGKYKLFFQFVPVEDAQPFFTKQVLLAGLGGYLGTILALGLLFFFKGVDTDWVMLDSEKLAELSESLFRGCMIATCVLGIAALGAWMMRQDGEQKASFAFSMVLHTALLFMVYELYEGDPFKFPGPPELASSYIVSRIETKPPPPEVKAVASKSGPKAETGAAAPKTPSKPKNTATKGAEGAAGGKGDTERARDKNAKPDEKPDPPKIAMLEDKNRAVLDNIVDPSLATNLGKFSGIPGETKRGSLGFGVGMGTGVGIGTGTGTTRGGRGKGPGGNGNVEGDFVSHHGKINTGTDRPGGGNCATPPCGTAPREIKVALAAPSGDFGGLTAEEIDRVMRARAGLFRACYQRELNHSPGIGGKMVIKFSIGGDGTVKSAGVGSGSQFHNAAVESCVKTVVMKLHFPAKGGVANVNYPFVFTQGG